MTVTPVDIDYTDPARGRLLVDGVDVSDKVTALRFEVDRTALPVLTVQTIPAAGRIFGAAVVVHELPAEPDPSGAGTVLRFLDGCDPAELERQALAGLGLDGESLSTGEAMLATLRRWAADA